MAFIARKTTVLLLATAWLAVSAASSAFGSTGHEFLSSLSEAPVGVPLAEPDAVAVDRVDGRVFVADSGAGMVDVYSSAGAFVTQFGEGKVSAASLAVDEATGYVYVADTFQNAVLVFKPGSLGGYVLLSEWRGESLPGRAFGEVTGVAVDNSKSASAGDVYVVDAFDEETGEGAVDVYQPKPSGPEEAHEGDLLRQQSAPKLAEPNGVAVSGASGEVYVADSARGAIYVFSPAGTQEGKPLTGGGSPQGSFSGHEEEPGNVSAVAVDPTTGDLLVAESERHVVGELSSSGEWLGWITQTPQGPLGEPRGVGVGPSGHIYVADPPRKVVDVFGAGVLVPEVATARASQVARTSATLNGTINGDGKAAKYAFQWGTTEALGQSTPITSAGTSEEAVSASLSGLQPSTTYFFRISGENANGSNVGAIEQFTTPTAVEGLATREVTNLTPQSATLTGALKPGGIDAHYFFEWGTTSAYGQRSPQPSSDAGSGKASVAVETTLNGLQANTIYHYRLVAENELGTTQGEDRTFQTSGPPRIASEATTEIGHEQATIHARVDPDEIQTIYRFQYGQTTAYGSEIPVGGATIPAGQSPVAVSANLTKLKIGTSYHFRVIAENGVGAPVIGPDQHFQTVASAPVDASYTTGVSADQATLHAQVNPLGNDTTFYFQYGTESCQQNHSACTNIPSAPGFDIGAGITDQERSQALGGLRPDTVYYYRVVAKNALGVSEGPERTFTTQAEATPQVLPDARAWEMVSPPDKQGAPLEALTREGGLILASEDGNSLTYVANGALEEEVQGNRSPEWQQIIARRGANEWSSEDVATPSTKAKGVLPAHTPEYQLFSPDLSSALVEPVEQGTNAEPPLAPGETQATIYLRANASGTYSPLISEANTAPGTAFGGQIHLVSATADLSHALISSKVALTGPSSAPGLYEWSAGALVQVSVLPGGAAAKGLIELGYSNNAAHAISNDGSRITWTTDEAEPHLGHLYMRDSATGETVQLDAAQKTGEPFGAGTARYQTASGDGSRVFFTDRQRLTADSTAEPQSNKPDLYLCEMIMEGGKLACKLTDLSVDHNVGEHANVQGLVMGTSEDGSVAYFVAPGVLAENETANGETAQAGKANLYEVHFSGAAWTTTFLAALAGEDSPEWEGDGVANTAYLTARVSPNGRYFAFMSSARLTGYDNTDQASGRPDEEVYLYDSDNASLRCVSCNPSGARPLGVLDAEGQSEGLGLVVDRRKVWGELGHEHYLAGNIPGWTAENLTSALIQSRYLSNDGRLYFNSPDTLVPQATNHKENVYEFEPSGVGSCQSPTGACVSLISSGDSVNESAFLEATPDGSNVFFITAGQLLPQDTDTAFDIYDARECSPEATCLTPPQNQPPGCDETPTCRSALSAQQPPLQPAGSATLAAPGNAQPPPAKPQGKPKPTPKGPTRAQKLAKALKACHKLHAKKKRIACEKRARKLYRAKARAKKYSAKNDSAHKHGARPSAVHSRSGGGR